jgi:hypothetical protein
MWRLRGLEVLHLSKETLRSRTVISKKMNSFKIIILKLMMIITTNLYINLQTSHHIQEYIKVFNGIIPLIIFLGA